MQPSTSDLRNAQSSPSRKAAQGHGYPIGALLPDGSRWTRQRARKAQRDAHSPWRHLQAGERAVMPGAGRKRAAKLARQRMRAEQATTKAVMALANAIASTPTKTPSRPRAARSV